MKNQIKIIYAFAVTVLITLTSCSHDTTCYCKIQDVSGVKYPTAKHSLGQQHKKVAEYKCKDIEKTYKNNANNDKENTSCEITIYKESCLGGKKIGGL